MGFGDAPLPTLSSCKDWNSLAGIEEQALSTLLIGNSRPIVGRQLRQHFGLQGGKSRYVRGVRGSAFARDPSMRFRCSIGSHPAIHFFQARIPFATSGPFAIRGLPFFPREGSRTRFASPSWCRRGRTFEEPISPK